MRIASVATLALLFACNTDSAKKDDNAQKTAEVGKPLYSCYRHITNRSSCPWKFQVQQDGTQYGNVYFGDGTLANCTQQNGPCTIPANTTIQIQYTTTDGSAQGVMDVTDQNGKMNNWFYVNKVVDICPDYHHSGNTGAVALNDPADGDLNAWGQCTW
jgi:hypothetical protein